MLFQVHRTDHLPEQAGLTGTLGRLQSDAAPRRIVSQISWSQRSRTSFDANLMVLGSLGRTCTWRCMCLAELTIRAARFICLGDVTEWVGFFILDQRGNTSPAAVIQVCKCGKNREDWWILCIALDFMTKSRGMKVYGCCLLTHSLTKGIYILKKYTFTFSVSLLTHFFLNGLYITK